MRYFDHRKESHPLRNLLLSLVFFLLLFGICSFALEQISAKTNEEEVFALQQAIQKSVAHCYAIEGHYPESLDYLKEEYSISYDTDKYFIDYQIWGENIFPEITIIQK